MLQNYVVLRSHLSLFGFCLWHMVLVLMLSTICLSKYGYWSNYCNAFCTEPLCAIFTVMLLTFSVASVWKLHSFMPSTSLCYSRRCWKELNVWLSFFSSLLGFLGSCCLVVLLSDEVEVQSMWFNSVAVRDLNNFMTLKPNLIITCRVRVGRSEEVLIQILPLGGHHVSGQI